MAETALTSRKTLGMFLTSLFLLLVFMSYQVTDATTGRTVLGNVLFRLFSPVQLGVAASARTVVYVVQNYFALAGANVENQRLKKELAELKIRLATASSQSSEVERLRQILELRPKLPYTLIAAEVIGHDARSDLSDTITVNRGLSQGVNVQTPAVTPTCIVGITIQVASGTSRIQLITDPSSSVGAMLRQERVSGILSGLGGEVCVLKFLPIRTNVKKDDVVVTSGQDGIFPEGLAIGKVTRILKESQYYRSAEVVPLQNFSSLKEIVFLLHPVEKSPNP
jgi:rod shape-determining protein MreC